MHDQSVQLCLSEEDIEHILILRKASLTQEQWNDYLSEDFQGNREASSSGSGSGKPRGGGRADSAVNHGSGNKNTWAKRFSRDVEDGTAGGAAHR